MGNADGGSSTASYDIKKDGFLVANLTLAKSAYRLGETVNAMLVVNSEYARVLRVSFLKPPLWTVVGLDVLTMATRWRHVSRRTN
jgi:hypothetical protein